MPEVVYYAACSVDGFVADRDGGVSWLPEATPGEDYGYAEFVAAIDAMVMGSRTYEQALTLGPWPYSKPCWVMSARALETSADALRVTGLSAPELLADLAGRGHERVWLVGGPTLAGSFQRQGLIDEYWLTVIPKLLGEGVPLLTGSDRLECLSLVETREYRGGAVQLRYRRERA